MGKDKKFDYQIKTIYGYLNEKKNKMVALVEINGTQKLDIRSCYEDEDGKLKPSKGISLSKDELKELRKLLKLVPDDILGKEPVDFNEIFSSASGIIDKREAGYTTEDGFIKLSKKRGVKLR